MMKKGIYAFLAVLTVFAMVMTGCPSDSGNDTTYTVTFDSRGGSNVGPITAKSGAKITAPANPTFEDPEVTFGGWYKVSSNFTYKNKWDFSSDTVKNNITLYAKWDKNAYLDIITLDGADFLDTEGADFGEPDDDLDGVGPGLYEVLTEQPAGGIAIEVKAQKTENVKWLISRTDPTEAAFNAATNPTAKQKFQSSDKLYIRIVNGDTTKYYKINFYFAVVETVYYNQPSIKGSDTEAVDALWEANYQGPIFDISRVNKTEVTPEYKFYNTVKVGENHTSGTAKAYWDDYGLYVYATIKYNDYYENAEAKAAGTVTARVTNMIGNYNSDSLEIMINPRYQLLPDNEVTCQQYRVGFNNGITVPANETYTNSYGTFSIGGNWQGNPASLPNPRHIFGQTYQYNAWKTIEGGKETGYKVICRVPWVLIGYPDTSAVFGADGKVKANATIGLDFQINASTEDGKRDALLTCSSVSLQALTHTTNYAKITLTEGAGKTRAVETNYPTIDANSPPSIIGETAEMKIDAVVCPKIPTPALSYQWWSADTETATGSAISGAASATYTPPDSTAATGKYFWVVVTNTNSAAPAGKQTALVISRRFKYSAPLVVNNPVIEPIGNTAAAADGKFTLNATNGDQGITYRFPATPDVMTAFKTIKIDYTLAKVPSSETRPMKLIVKQGYNKFTADDNIPSGPYKDKPTDGAESLTLDLATNFTKNKDGFTFQMNTDQNQSCTFTIQVNKITFSN